MNRVVITGMGVVSPVGDTIEEFWSALVEPRCGIGPITIIPTERLNVRIAAQIGSFDPLAHFDAKRVNLLDRVAQFAVVAARAAVRDALVAAAIEENIHESAKNLLTDSAVLRHALKEGKLTIIEAIYSLETGRVTRLGKLSVAAPAYKLDVGDVVRVE